MMMLPVPINSANATDPDFHPDGYDHDYDMIMDDNDGRGLRLSILSIQIEKTSNFDLPKHFHQTITKGEQNIPCMTTLS